MALRLGVTVVFLLSLPLSASAYRYVHEVLPGENLRSIAARYKVSIKKIKRRNRLRSNRLRAGRKLKIDSPMPVRQRFKVRYTVKKGDSLSRIAKRYKVKTRLLKRLNPKKRRLRIGQRIWVVSTSAAPKGAVKGLVQLSDGPGYTVRDVKRAWTTFLGFNRLHEAFTAYALRFPKYPPIRVMDASRKGGGYFRPHKSHRDGRDIDIGYPRKKKYRHTSLTRPKGLDVTRMWFLLRKLVESGDVVYVFMDRPLQKALYEYALNKLHVSKASLAQLFQYPRRRAAGIVRHDPGHATHFHVRFRREKNRSGGKKVGTLASQGVRGHRARP